MEMEGLVHMSHEHPLTLTEYDSTPEEATCFGCPDAPTVGESVYRCSRVLGTSSANLGYKCASFFLHKKCSELPPHIHHPTHEAHHLSLSVFPAYRYACCNVCDSGCREYLYRCKPCEIFVCLQCALQERKLNHELHSHPLTLLPLKSVFPCGACGVKGVEEFSYLCQTCLFWVHKSCTQESIICKAHHRDHPLLLSDYSILNSYPTYGLICSICELKFDKRYWLYYCFDCRFFAHIECATKRTDENATEVGEEEDVNNSELVKFPVCNDDDHYLYYQLIQDFAKTRSSTSTDNHASTTEDGIVSHCALGHPLGLINEHLTKDVHKLNEMLCDGCFQPLSFAADLFYSCIDCNFFLHKVCFSELPRAIEHPSHPEHRFLKCPQIGETIKCNICYSNWSGIFYKCESSSCSFTMDIICASLPRKIKHESHKHSLAQHVNKIDGFCRGCWFGIVNDHCFSCNKCQFVVHVGCATSPGIIKHRWDEHQLCLVYPPVKHHPHDFDCECCSFDINPNYWFYHCRECDTSIDLRCIMKAPSLLTKSNLYNLRFRDDKYLPLLIPDDMCAIM